MVLEGGFEVLPNQRPADTDDRNGDGGEASGTSTLLGPGSIVGEIAVLRAGTRTASRCAVEDAEVAAIDGARFLEVLDTLPDLGLELALARTASSHRGDPARFAHLASGRSAG